MLPQTAPSVCYIHHPYSCGRVPLLLNKRNRYLLFTMYLCGYGYCLLVILSRKVRLVGAENFLPVQQGVVRFAVA